jgi:lipopolysaccharide transport system permease protein
MHPAGESPVSSVSEVDRAPLDAAPVPDRAVNSVAQDDLPVTVIEARKGWQLIDFRELWRYRELLWCLTWRDVAVRYKQAVLGVAWAVLQPLSTMIVFTLVLGRTVGAQQTDVPYPLHVFAGMMTWTFFSSAVNSAANSVVGNQNLITKVYFPRLVVPLSAVGVSFVDLAISFVMLFVLMLWFGVLPTATFAMVPVSLVLLAAAAMGIGTLLSALTVAYRDFRYALSFGMQLWMFATPCIYVDPLTALGERSRWLLPLNPAYGLILNFQNAVLGRAPDFYALAVSGTLAMLSIVIGAAYFRRVERSFADII